MRSGITTASAAGGGSSYPRAVCKEKDWAKRIDSEIDWICDWFKVKSNRDSIVKGGCVSQEQADCLWKWCSQGKVQCGSPYCADPTNVSVCAYVDEPPDRPYPDCRVYFCKTQFCTPKGHLPCAPVYLNLLHEIVHCCVPKTHQGEEKVGEALDYQIVRCIRGYMPHHG
jgi:hypothetical protein